MQRLASNHRVNVEQYIGQLEELGYGAAAESAGLGDELKANATDERVLSLARSENYFL